MSGGTTYQYSTDHGKTWETVWSRKAPEAFARFMIKPYHQGGMSDLHETIWMVDTTNDKTYEFRRSQWKDGRKNYRSGMNQYNRDYTKAYHAEDRKDAQRVVIDFTLV